jgi:hypothetical protein
MHIFEEKPSNLTLYYLFYNMKRTFFDFISSASEEKIHSQTLGWLLSEYCDALSDSQKQEFLKLLIGDNEYLDYTIEYVFVEFNDIDLLIVCNNFVVVIENKIKSSEHSNQLEKYVLLVKNNVTEESKEKYINSLKNEKQKNQFNIIRENIQRKIEEFNQYSYFVYLNFIEKDSNHNDYINVTYHDILSYFNSIEPNEVSKIDKFIFESYRNTLKNLQIANEEFRTNMHLRKWVAENPKYSKNDLLGKLLLPKGVNPEIIKYIVENNFINTIQLNFLNLVVKELRNRCTIPNTEISAEISATMRQGLIQITFKNLMFIFSDLECYFGYQLEIISSKSADNNGTEKITLTTNKINHKALKKIETIFRPILAKELTDWKPQGIKTKGSKGNYISATKSFEKNKYFSDFDLKNAVDFFSNRLLNDDSDIYKKLNSLHESIKNRKKHKKK